MQYNIICDCGSGMRTTVRKYATDNPSVTMIRLCRQRKMTASESYRKQRNRQHNTSDVPSESRSQRSSSDTSRIRSRIIRAGRSVRSAVKIRRTVVTAGSPDDVDNGASRR